MRRFWRLCWLFALASMAGFLLESAESLVSLGYVQNRQGLLYGPFTPVYGAGAVALALLWPALRHRGKAFCFLAAALVGTGVEYLWSWGQERWFGAVFWDYHHFPLHLDGRVNLPFALFWGLLGLAFWQWVWPRFSHCQSAASRYGVGLVSVVLTLLLLSDGILSAAALYRQAQRQEQAAAVSPLALYLDEVWPDEALARRFPTMRRVT